MYEGELHVLTRETLNSGQRGHIWAFDMGREKKERRGVCHPRHPLSSLPLIAQASQHISYLLFIHVLLMIKLNYNKYNKIYTNLMFLNNF
jgi:hypothetical protein